MPGMGFTHDAHTEMRGKLRSDPVENPLVLWLELHGQPGQERPRLNNPVKMGSTRDH